MNLFNSKGFKLTAIWFGIFVGLMIVLYFVNQYLKAPWAGVAFFAALVSGILVSRFAWRIF